MPTAVRCQSPQIMASAAAPAANAEAFPFRKLPPELRNIIHFESGLGDYDILALTIATNNPKKECAIVQEFMATQLDHIPHEGTLESVLAIQQTIYFTGSQQGSFDWPRFMACKQALYDNKELTLDEAHLAITFSDITDVLEKAEWVYLIVEACNKNWNMWCKLEEEDGFLFSGTVGHIRGACFDDKLTKTELVRLVLAVYQFRAYASSMHQGADEMPYEEAASVSKAFFQHLTPWEKEQIIGVSDILASVTQHGADFAVLSYMFEAESEYLLDAFDSDPVFALLRQYYGYTADKIPNRSRKQEMMLRSVAFSPDLSLLRHSVFGGYEHWSGDDDDVEDQLERLDSYTLILGEGPPWSVLLEKWAYSEHDEDAAANGGINKAAVNTAKYSSPAVLDQLLNIDHDRERDNGPRVNWDSYFVMTRGTVASRATETGQGPGSSELAIMRSIGYVFWDLYTAWCNCHWSPEEHAELSEKDTSDEEGEEEDEGQGLSDEEYSETEDDDDDFAVGEVGVHEHSEEGDVAEDDKVTEGDPATEGDEISREDE
ncbi:hypothetical protein GE09DRAFT_562310 [Coniochaeta sp. 2T2.1]|nr:hypothetical protein GE09DRAFT_562310 [Coniochaeta sp. 2T2.1]